MLAEPLESFALGAATSNPKSTYGINQRYRLTHRDSEETKPKDGVKNSEELALPRGRNEHPLRMNSEVSEGRGK
jgi:hypothetical protein